MQLVKPVIVSALIAIAGAAAGCVVTPGTVVSGTYTAGVYGETYTTTSPTNTGREPIIHAFTPSVNSIDKDGTITFTVVANSPSGKPLQYNWSATKGLLSGNSGQTVSWNPKKASDGSLDVGIATITVILTDGQYATTGTVNIQVTSSSATVVGTGGAAASPSPSAAATATPAPTAAPTATPSPEATATPTPAATATAAPAATGAATPSPAATATADPSATH